MPRDDADKTEKPTPKRRREARRKGEVAKSPDAAGFASLFAASLLLPTVVHSAGQRLVALVGQSQSVMSHPTQAGAMAVLDAGLGDVVVILLPMLGLMAGISLLTSLAQTGPILAGSAVAPRWSHVDPVQGVRRILSVQSLWGLAKQILKLGVLLVIGYHLVAILFHQLLPTAPVALGPVIGVASTQILALVRDTAGAGLVLSVADYAFQRHQFVKQHKMTKREVRDELRHTEGDPHVRSVRRRRQLSMSKMRMMAAVAGADVVVTNPTHYAVALRYDPSQGGSPRVVAKGADEVALRIREEARAHDVPVVEDAPLARAIHGACALDAPIPRELYLAVARLLAFVLSLPAVVRRSGTVHRRPTTALVA